MKVEWGTLKSVLLFLGLVTKAVSASDPLPFPWGAQAKSICSILWMAFEGSFVYLLKPPPQPKPTSDHQES